jgi:methyltransferase (TIGR00027 family)
MDAQPSITAMRVAVKRGQHRLEDPLPWILDDSFALMLVGPEWRVLAAEIGSQFPERFLGPGRASAVLRSRYAEDRLMQGSFTQYVMLGAGLDSFAWRRPDLLGELRVFEVDHPASQAWKRQRVAELGLPTSENHVFAPVDFEVQSLRDGLDAVGFDWTQPTMFSWLGVIVYLSMDAVEATFRTVAACRSGSEVAFEYVLTEEFVEDIGREYKAIFSPLVGSLGEPAQTEWPPTEAERVVTSCGLRVADHPSRDELVSRYFADRTDGLEPLWGVRLLTATAP